MEIQDWLITVNDNGRHFHSFFRGTALDLFEHVTKVGLDYRSKTTSAYLLGKPRNFRLVTNLEED